MPEPFYTEAQPCGSCGKPCDSLKPCTWDSDLLVGPCCEVHSDDLPEEMPLCAELYRVVCQAQTVQAVCDAFRLHEASGCMICQGSRKEVEIESQGTERRAA